MGPRNWAAVASETGQDSGYREPMAEQERRAMEACCYLAGRSYSHYYYAYGALLVLGVENEVAIVLH